MFAHRKSVLIGVVSSGKGCATSSYSGIYMRVSAFADWIKQNAGDVCTQDSTARPFRPTATTRKPIATTTRKPIAWMNTMYTVQPANPTMSTSSGWMDECTCTSFINPNGYGQCEKGDSDFGGSVSCYVALPSSCKDLVRSGSHPNKFVSAEACEKHLGDQAPIQSGCTCTDFINPYGFGKCQKADSDFEGSVSCYVHLPSPCKDLVRSGSHPKKFLSSEACGNERGCTCTDFINPNGYGQCRKADSDFGGSFTCYVALPSSCKDLVRSGSHPSKYLSSEACDEQTYTQQQNIIPLIVEQPTNNQ